MEDDSWAQTLFTITPDEDGYIREITEATIISGSRETQLNLDNENIEHRESLATVTRDFIDPRELEKSEYRESECQTYMGGVPRVQYIASHRDKASQTLYIGKNPLPRVHQKEDVLQVLNEKSLPKLKKSQLVQTIVTVMEDLPGVEILEGLLQEITDEEQNDPELMVNATETELTKMEASDLLSFIVERAWWIAGNKPKTPVSTVSVGMETTLKYNYCLRRFMRDMDTQTSISLAARKSTSALLDNYLELKNSKRNILEGLMETGVYPRIMIDDIIDEIIGRCSEFVQLPMRSEAIQTIASGRPFNAKDDEVLKRLRNSVATDPLESFAIVPEIVDEILGGVIEVVSVDARNAAKFVVDRVFHKTSVIGNKLDEIKTRSSSPPMDQIFARRKLKLAAAMPQKKQMENASTQTGLAGVPQLRRYQENKGVVCSVCPTQSECQWCLSEGEEPPPKKMKMLRTQDILLAYKPCYVVMDPAEATDNMRRECLPEPKAPPLQAHVSSDNTSSSESSSVHEQFEEIVERRSPRVTGSASGWSHVVDTALTDVWISKSPSRESKLTASTKASRGGHKSPGSQMPLPKTAIEALQVLKTTFCNREACPGLSNIIENPKCMSTGSSSKASAKNRQLYVCTDFAPPSDDCICELNNQLHEKLKILLIQAQIKTKR